MHMTGTARPEVPRYNGLDVVDQRNTVLLQNNLDLLNDAENH